MLLTFTATLSFQHSFCSMVSNHNNSVLSITCIAIFLCFIAHMLISLIACIFFPVIQYFVSPLLVAHGFFPMLVSNLLFMVAISYYHYLNFLGYDGMQDMMLSITLMTNDLFLSEFRHGKLIARCSREMKISDAVLPFLDKTTFFLYPIGLVIILSPLSKFL